MKRQLAQRQK